MLNLFQSNQMSELADAFCARNSDFKDPFEATTVIVQSFGLGQWLKLRLAEQHGIASNVDCVLPATFLWRLYQALIPETRLLNESPYEMARLTWRIMHLLRNNPNIAIPVRRYLDGTGDKDLRLYQLANELALLFDEYLMYRPDWILKWQTNRQEYTGHEAWQAELWRLIEKDLGDDQHLHRAALHRRTLEALSSYKDPAWRKLSVFGLSTMAPLQLETFEALAVHLDVDIYFLNPCAHYWGDIVSEKDKARRSIRQLVKPGEALLDEDYLEVGNPLLSSLGKQGREFFELLLENEALVSDEQFITLPDTSALNFVKNDIMELTFGGEFGSDISPEKSSYEDDSIQIHSCHSRLREIEVLHDEILRSISQSPDLRLNDIIVMMPDISLYAPFIQSVFTGSLSYRIADSTSLANSTLLNTFLKLLNLVEMRVSGPEVMDLLETPAVMRRFGLTQEDLETLAYWINESGIRWGLNAADKSDTWQLPAEHRNTWQFGLERLLLGFAMQPDQSTWQGILPFEIRPAEADLLGRIGHIIDQLSVYRTQLKEPRSAVDWQILIGDLTNDFFDPRDSETLDINRLSGIVEDLVSQSEPYEQEISQQVVSHFLSRALSSTETPAGFVSGGITFATLVPMRSIPFRMVCLLGMNDAEYPRDVRPHSFDLIANSHPEKGDRSKKLDDRYLFLEAIGSAQDTFYVSYIGKGARDNKDRPPSVVVSEWENYLAEVFTDIETIEHALQPFNRRYYQGDQRQSYSTSWFHALTAKSTPTAFQAGAIRQSDTDCASTNQLSAFLRHPARYYLQQRLNVYFDSEEVELKDTETFEPDHLERFNMADQALIAMINEQDLDQFRHAEMHSGKMLGGAIGEFQLEREINRAKNIYAEVTGYLNAPAAPLKTSVTIQSTDLQFELDSIYGDHIVNFRAGTLRARQLLDAWINHLAANCVLKDINTVCIFKGKDDVAETLRLKPVHEQEASSHLEYLLSLYRQGNEVPLFLPPEASRFLVEETRKGLELQPAVDRTRQHWRNDQLGTESSDRYWARLFDFPEVLNGQFPDDALCVWTPILDSIADE